MDLDIYGKYQKELEQLEQKIYNYCLIWECSFLDNPYLEELDKLKKKIEHYHSANELVSRGRSLHRERKYEEAIAFYDKALDGNPTLYNIWSIRGNALAASGKYAEAVTSYDKALNICQGYYPALHNRGNALAYLGKEAEARESWHNALKSKPDYMPVVSFYDPF